MFRSSPVVNINSNRKHTPMRISQFLSDLSMMDDDSEKIMKLDDFICSIEDELRRLFGSQHQFPFSVLFLKEAIDRFKEMKRVCEVHAISKIVMAYKRSLDKDARPQNILVDYSGKNTIAYFNDKEVINVESDDEEANYISAPSIHGSTCSSSAPAIQSGSIGFDPREKRVRNSFETPSVMIGQEPPVKRMKIWPVELYTRFLHVVNTLGGPTVATPKEIKDRMQVTDITEDEIINHLMNLRLDNSCRARGASPLVQFHDTRSMVGQDVLNMSGNRIQSGSQQMPLRIGESSNGQMAAAGNNTNGGWKLIQSGSQQMPLRIGESSNGQMAAAGTNNKNGSWKLIQSGSQQMPLRIGESSNGQMAAAGTNNTNGSWKLIQSGSQQMPLRIGESSNGQMAAAGTNNTNGGWNLICSAPTQDMLKMRGIPVQSGYPQTPLYAGESSSRQMAAAPHEANGGRSVISAPYIYGNGPMNTHM